MLHSPTVTLSAYDFKSFWIISETALGDGPKNSRKRVKQLISVKWAHRMVFLSYSDFNYLNEFFGLLEFNIWAGYILWAT